MRAARDPVVRRRRAAVGLAALASLVAGAAVGAGSDDRGAAERAAATQLARGGAAPPPPEALAQARRLPLERRVGRLVLMRFHGARAPASVLRALSAGRVAGVILFADNAPSRSSLRRLTASLHDAAGGRAIVATDQEGGTVRRLKWAEPVAAQAALLQPDQAAAAHLAAAGHLRAAGINVNLAPVADVPTSPAGALSDRAFPGAPADVARLVAAAVRAYDGTGVAPTVKHFPGLGGAAANTDDSPVTLTRHPAEIAAHDLPPFVAAVAARVPAVMVSHALYPALDPRRIASQSPAVIGRLLRGRLGFPGVVVTDALEAAAVRALSGPGRAAVRSVAAGADLVLATHRGSQSRVRRALLAEARRSPAFARRVTEAAARVLALESSLHSHTSRRPSASAEPAGR